MLSDICSFVVILLHVCEKSIALAVFTGRHAFLHTQEVVGSSPIVSTIINPVIAMITGFVILCIVL